MKKSTKKKIRDIRSALVMVLVMVAMLSTASYAWFTMSDSPTVTGMQMTAATAGGGLEVSNDGAETNYFSAIETNLPDKQTLRPVTPDTNNAGQFLKPVYQGNTVKSVTDIEDTIECTQYVAKYEFWLRSKSSETVNVGLVFGDATQTTALKLNSGAPAIEGSIVKQIAPTTTNNPSYAVRVGFRPVTVTQGGSVIDLRAGASGSALGKMFIWEPNAEANENATCANTEVTVTENVDIRSHTTGKVMDASGNVDNSNYISDALFSLSGTAAVKIEMYIWLEGSDLQCGDEIQAKDLEAQVQFTPVEKDI